MKGRGVLTARAPVPPGQGSASHFPTRFITKRDCYYTTLGLEPLSCDSEEILEASETSLQLVGGRGQSSDFRYCHFLAR